jgi:uncharacterized protein YcbX
LTFMLADTTGSDIADHVLVALVAVLPVLIPVLIGMRKQRKHLDKAAARVEQATQTRAQHVDQAETTKIATLSRIESKLDDHLANSTEFWDEQRAEMTALAQALGEHTQDHHIHEMIVGKVRKATSEPLTPGKPAQRSSRGRQRPKATGD